MKRCPECRRDYYDDTLLYCLDDGNALLEGPASGSGAGDEPATILSEPPALAGGRSASESPARAHIHRTGQTAILPTGAEAAPQEDWGRLAGKRSLSAHRAAKPLAALIVTALILVGGYFGYRYFQPATSEQINSIAVLPFENRSNDPDADYLSDGLAESLIFRLSQLPDLKVSPTSSVMHYKGRGGNLVMIAKELGVQAVMIGKLVQRGDSLTISIELVDVPNNKLLWGEQYERKVSELLNTQREIAAIIADKLRVKLAGNDKGVTKKYTDNNEAYQLYLKGRFHFARRTKADMERSIELLHQATELDPNFALAYVGIAEIVHQHAVLSVHLAEGGFAEGAGRDRKSTGA
jgi:TolB-like protein